VKERWLFLCSTPYTLFNAINLLQAQDKSKIEADLVVFERSPAVKKYASTKASSQIFSRVYLVKDFQGTKWLLPYSMLFFAFPKLVFRWVTKKHRKMPKEQYTKLISQNYYFATLFYRIYSKATYYQMEDGLGSYANQHFKPGNRAFPLNIVEKIAGNRLVPSFAGQYVYRPELVPEGFLSPFPLKNSGENIEQLEPVFQYQKNDVYQTHRIVFFGDNAMHCENRLKYRLYEDILRQIQKKEKIVYRRHPAEGEERPFEHKILYDTYENMWELECGKQISDEHILVNFFSTAALTPKILYDREPMLVFLFPILGLKWEIEDSYRQYVDKIRKLYRNPEKIIVVEKEDDLRKVILDR
jgi:hypothetical protein